MTNDAFLKDLAEVLEVDPSKLANDFELTSEVWDSLTVLATIALVDEHFDIAVDSGDLDDCPSVASLLDRIQAKVGT